MFPISRVIPRASAIPTRTRAHSVRNSHGRSTPTCALSCAVLVHVLFTYTHMLNISKHLRCASMSFAYVRTKTTMTKTTTDNKRQRTTTCTTLECRRFSFFPSYVRVLFFPIGSALSEARPLLLVLLAIWRARLVRFVCGSVRCYIARGDIPSEYANAIARVTRASYVE